VEEHHEPAPLRQARPLELTAAALLVARVPLTFLGDGILLGVGVVALALFVVTGALALLRRTRSTHSRNQTVARAAE
jgi:hypothetical protein